MAKGIYERKGQGGDVTYYIRYQFQGTDIKEHVGRKSRGFTRATAKKALKSRLGDIARGQFSLEKTRRPVPFSTLLQQYDDYAKNNWRGYDSGKYFIQALGQYFGDTPLSQITSWHTEKWKAEFRKTHKPNSVNRHLTVLKHIFKKAIEWEHTKNNPAAGVKRLPDEERTRYLTEEEWEQLLSTCREMTNRPWLPSLVTLATHTGLRRGEFLTLKWENVDLDRKLIIIRQSKSLNIKSIPLNKSALEALLWLQQHRYGDYVLMQPWGKPFTRSVLDEAFVEARKRAGLKDLHFHDLRHTFGSHLVMAGADLPTVSKLMGHTKITMTMRYAHLAPKHLAEAVAKLDTKLAQNRHIPVSNRSQVTGISGQFRQARLLDQG